MTDAPPAAVVDALARVLARVLVDAIRREDDAATPTIRPPAPPHHPPRKQVRRDAQVSIVAHLTDSAIVTEAHSLIHLALGRGATTAQMPVPRAKTGAR
jgi:hypothetical protein